MLIMQPKPEQRLGHALITRLASLMSGLPLTAAGERLACEVADGPGTDSCTAAVSIPSPRQRGQSLDRKTEMQGVPEKAVFKAPK